ncbi:MAG TPA: WecB/TagA/CpsF family glycosyltransferase [Gemmatimonadales bacterium]
MDCVDTESALGRIESMVQEGGHHLVATVNPEFVMRARSDREFARVLESASLCIPDGQGVVWAARRQGCEMSGPVTGVDLIPPLAGLCAKRGWRMFLLGAAPGVADELAGRLRADHPDLEVDAAADDESAELVRQWRPHVLLVAFGAPRQEMWIDHAARAAGVPVAMGVGGSFDYLTGRVPRAPGWMRRAGLEWLYRLGRQPWRLKRMAVLPGYAIGVITQGRQGSAP